MRAERIAAGLALALLVLIALLLAQHSCSRQRDSYQGQQAQAPRSNDAKTDPLKNGMAQHGDQDADSRTKNQPEAHSQEASGWGNWLYKLLHDHDKFWVALGTIVIGAFTVVLSIATVLLAISTKKLWKAGERQIEVAKQAAEAAKKAADIGAAAERPHVLLMELQVAGLKQAANAAGEIELKCSYKFQNFGRSPAFMDQTCVRLNWGPLPQNPLYPNATVIPHIIAPVTGTYFTRGHVGGLFVPQGIAEGVMADNLPVHVYGLLTYKSVLGQMHTFRFCCRLVFEGNDGSVQFRPGGPDSYWEYT